MDQLELIFSTAIRLIQCSDIYYLYLVIYRKTFNPNLVPIS